MSWSIWSVKTYLRRLWILAWLWPLLGRIAAGQAGRNWLGYNCSIGSHAVGWRTVSRLAHPRFLRRQPRLVVCCYRQGEVAMQLESERAGGVFVKGYQNVADGSEAATNYSGVRSCGRLPFENAPNGSNRWGLECMDFGAVPAYVKAGWSASEIQAASSVTTFRRPTSSSLAPTVVGNTCINMRFSRVMKTGDWIKQM